MLANVIYYSELTFPFNLYMLFILNVNINMHNKKIDNSW